MKSLMQGHKALSMLVLGGAALFQFNAAGAVPLTVEANVVDFCQVDSTANVTFVNLTPGAGNASATGTITYTCSNGTDANVEIDNGGKVTRTMDHAGAGAPLPFQLFTDAPGGQVWGTTSGGIPLAVTGAGVTAPVNVDVFGQVLGTDIDDAAVGSYTDDVEVTLTIVP